MNPERSLLSRAPLPHYMRLENFGFGTTLAGMAVAVLVVVGAPMFGQGGYLANWTESCISLVSVAWPVASAVLGMSG